MKIDPSLRGNLPRVAPPVPWQSKDGLRNGWKVAIPGRRPLATPAVADGRLFLGGGFGSYEFYALDAATGHGPKKVARVVLRRTGGRPKQFAPPFLPLPGPARQQRHASTRVGRRRPSGGSPASVN
jgi:hypothetical protein